ncbi:hypothetical protein AN1V17_32950 [Vallitalea sediminicola]
MFITFPIILPKTIIKISYKFLPGYLTRILQYINTIKHAIAIAINIEIHISELASVIGLITNDSDNINKIIILIP